MRFRRKTTEISASQWFREGDHAWVMIPFRQPKKTCGCPCAPSRHGALITRQGTVAVCPGDWIITSPGGDHYPCKPDIFANHYEKL
jgi:hypothetical protein